LMDLFNKVTFDKTFDKRWNIEFDDGHLFQNKKCLFILSLSDLIHKSSAIQPPIDLSINFAALNPKSMALITNDYSPVTSANSKNNPLLSVLI